MKTVHVQPLNAWELGWLVPCSLFSTNVGPRRLHYAFATTYRSRVWSCLLVQVEWWTQNEHVVSSARRMRVNNGDGHHISSMLDCFENLHTGSTKSSTGGETAKHLLLPNPNRRHGRHMENHRPSLLRAHVPVTETLVIHRLSIASRRRRSPRAAAMEVHSATAQLHQQQLPTILVVTRGRGLHVHVMGRRHVCRRRLRPRHRCRPPAFPALTCVDADYEFSDYGATCSVAVVFPRSYYSSPISNSWTWLATIYKGQYHMVSPT